MFTNVFTTLTILAQHCYRVSTMHEHKLHRSLTAAPKFIFNHHPPLPLQSQILLLFRNSIFLIKKKEGSFFGEISEMSQQLEPCQGRERRSKQTQAGAYNPVM